MSLLKNITKESNPIRQTYYTTKRAWLVNFINIFMHTLKPVLYLRQSLYSCWFYLCWQWNLLIPSVLCTGITEKSPNAFYYACSYAKMDYSKFMNVTVSMALKLIPELLESQPVFLCIDDTKVPNLSAI